jgi:hypothetical protein
MSYYRGVCSYYYFVSFHAQFLFLYTVLQHYLQSQVNNRIKTLPRIIFVILLTSNRVLFGSLWWLVL